MRFFYSIICFTLASLTLTLIQAHAAPRRDRTGFSTDRSAPARRAVNRRAERRAVNRAERRVVNRAVNRRAERRAVNRAVNRAERRAVNNTERRAVNRAERRAVNNTERRAAHRAGQRAQRRTERQSQRRVERRVERRVNRKVQRRVERRRAHQSFRRGRVNRSHHGYYHNQRRFRSYRRPHRAIPVYVTAPPPRRAINSTSICIGSDLELCFDTLYHDGARYGVNGDLRDEERRIQRGIRSGFITPREARRLDDMLWEIYVLEDECTADGFLTEVEEADLYWAERDLNRAIRRETRDFDTW